MKNENKHPDPNRWWERKWKAVGWCTTFAAFIVVVALGSALLLNKEIADSTYRVMTFASPTFLVPLMGFFGFGEWNNQTKMKMEKEECEN